VQQLPLVPELFIADLAAGESLREQFVRLARRRVLGWPSGIAAVAAKQPDPRARVINTDRSSADRTIRYGLITGI
jgi:hypothetical protein